MCTALLKRITLFSFYWGTVTPWVYKHVNVQEFTLNPFKIYQMLLDHFEFCLFITTGYLVYRFITLRLWNLLSICCSAYEDQLKEVVVQKSTNVTQTILQAVPVRPAPAPPKSASLSNLVELGAARNGNGNMFQPASNTQKKNPALEKRRSVSQSHLLAPAPKMSTARMHPDSRNPKAPSASMHSLTQVHKISGYIVNKT